MENEWQLKCIFTPQQISHNLHGNLYLRLDAGQNALSAQSVLHMRLSVCVYACICLRPACGPLASQTIAKHSPGAEDASPEMPERILCKLQAGGEP